EKDGINCWLELKTKHTQTAPLPLSLTHTHTHTHTLTTRLSLSLSLRDTHSSDVQCIDHLPIVSVHVYCAKARSLRAEWRCSAHLLLATLESDIWQCSE